LLKGFERKSIKPIRNNPFQKIPRNKRTPYGGSMIKLSIIQDWLVQAGKMALGYFAKPELGFDFKIDNSIVTEADYAIETYLRSKIKEEFPDHAIIGEEYAGEAGNEFAWILDPIDGSAPFFWNIPTWCISIGVTRNFQPYMGFVYVPLTGDLYYSMDNKSYLNGKRIHTASVDQISRESAFCVSTRAFNKFSMVDYNGMVFALGSGIFNNMMVARGVVIGALSISPSIWDLAAAVKIVQDAGGKACYLNGEPVDIAALNEIKKVPYPVLTAPSQLMDRLLSIIKVS